MRVGRLFDPIVTPFRLGMIGVLCIAGVLPFGRPWRPSRDRASLSPCTSPSSATTPTAAVGKGVSHDPSGAARRARRSGRTSHHRSTGHLRGSQSLYHLQGRRGTYNLLIGDSTAAWARAWTGRIVIDSGDPEKGFKSHDWWATIRATTKGWSPEYSAPTFSSICWDRWILRNLYATGGDAGLFWDLTDNNGHGFTVVVEDCVGIGRAFGGGFGYPVTREKEPIVFRRCYLMSLDWWGDAGGLGVGAYNTSPPKHPDAICEDCTFVGPDNAVQILFPNKYVRLKMKNCRLISLELLTARRHAVHGNHLQRSCPIPCRFTSTSKIAS